MNTSSQAYQRKGKRVLPHIISMMFVVVAFGAVFFIVQQTMRPAPYRQSLVIAGNPARVVSWNAAKNQVTILDVPQEVMIDATGGYGSYRLGSLFTLDHLEHKHGILYTSSISDAIGLPVSWYIDPGYAVGQISGVDVVRSIFSLKNVWRALTHQMDTSMPIPTWMSFMFAASALSSDSVTVVAAGNAFVDTILPDTSVVKKLDPSRLDYLIDNAFMDTGLRAEGLTIGVYNTTGVPSVGERAARVMSHLGLQLVSVGNAAKEQTTCTVSGSSQVLSSKTAQFIRDYFHCQNGIAISGNQATVADISLYLGMFYASQFLQAK